MFFFIVIREEVQINVIIPVRIKFAFAADLVFIVGTDKIRKNAHDAENFLFGLVPEQLYGVGDKLQLRSGMIGEIGIA